MTILKFGIMKTKILLAGMACLCSSMLLAQTTTTTGTTFGIRAGVNFQNINGKDVNGNKLKNDVTTGFNVGVNAEIPVGTDTYVQPGVLFSTKGANWQGTDQKVHLSYIEVPVNFLYKPLLGTGHMLLGFGPYAAYGVGGKVKDDNGNSTKIEFEKEVSAVDASKPYFKPFDAGANLLVGYEMANNLSLQLNAQLGLVNINPEYQNVTNDKRSWKNTGFGLSLGYRF